jgi:hypothetical protein
MQIPIESPHSFWFNALLALAGILTGGGALKLYNSWAGRKKIPADIDKTKAETRQIDAHTDSEISQSMARVTLRLEEMQKRVDQIVSERDAAVQLAAMQKIDLDLALHQIKRLAAANELGIKLSDLDQLK